MPSVSSLVPKSIAVLTMEVKAELTFLAIEPLAPPTASHLSIICL